MLKHQTKASFNMQHRPFGSNDWNMRWSRDEECSTDSYYIFTEFPMKNYIVTGRAWFKYMSRYRYFKCFGAINLKVYRATVFLVGDDETQDKLQFNQNLFVPWRRSRTVLLPRSPDLCHTLPVPRTTSCPWQRVHPPSPVTLKTQKTTFSKRLVTFDSDK